MAARTKSNTGKQTGAKRSSTRTPAAKQAAGKKSTGTRAAAKKAAPKKAAPKKAAAKKAAAKKPAAKKTAPKQTAPKKAAASKRAPAKKAAAKRAAAKTPAKKTPAKKTPAKKSPAKKSAATKPAPKRPASTRTGAGAARPAKPTSGFSSLLSNDVPEMFEVPKPRGKSKDGISYTKDFDVKFLKAQRAELLARREAELARATRLEDEATSLIEDGEMGDVQFDDEGGEGDTMVVQRDLDRLLSGQARQTVADIDAALQRIEDGTYGYSVVSGRPIPRERLEAIPETTVLAVEKISGAGHR